MAQVFDPDEIFEMALQMERNGARFYKEAAEGVSDSSNRSMLLKLAEMEVEHEKTFFALKMELGENEAGYYDPEGIAVMYLQSIANTKIFFKREIDVTSMESILKEAVMAERDSIIFYLGMKEMIPDEAGKQKIEKIIKEEMSHVQILGEKLLELKS